MSVVEFFNGKNVFITGGTGFLGKVLVEKLLRSCEGLGNIYVLMRSKRGRSIEERLEHIKGFPLFDKVRNENPELLNKIIPIHGDVRELKLGMSEKDRQLIINRVHIVYHTAASVKFDDPLKDAIITNVRGTREVVELAKELKNLSVLVHVSTAYCNCDKMVVDEILYPAPADWRDALQMAEGMDDSLINTFSEKYISPLPNTYTFAKALGEHVVTDMCKGKIPAVIVRPTVVLATIKEPMLGWVDNFNGPVGLLVAGGKGILRTVLGNPDICQDFFPVDTVANILMVTAKVKATQGWVPKSYNLNHNLFGRATITNGLKIYVFSLTIHWTREKIARKLNGGTRFIHFDHWIIVNVTIQGWDKVWNHVNIFQTKRTIFMKICRNIEDVDVYHASKANHNQISVGEMIQMGERLIWDSPFSEVLWYPRFKMTKCWYNYYIQVLLFHMIPAFFIDLLLRITGRKPMLFSIQRKVYIANVVLEHFLLHNWTFKHEKSMSLLDQLEEKEKPIFGFDRRFMYMDKETAFDYFRNGKIFGACFILNEKFDFTRTTSVRNMKRLWIIDIVVKTIFFSILMWLVFIKMDILTVLYSSFENYITNL